MVIHGLDGLDEISLSHETLVSEVKDGSIKNYILTPEMFSIKRSCRDDIRGGDAAENAKIILSLLTGKKVAKKRCGFDKFCCSIVCRRSCLFHSGRY